jgi:hypothetical protein
VKLLICSIFRRLKLLSAFNNIAAPGATATRENNKRLRICMNRELLHLHLSVAGNEQLQKYATVTDKPSKHGTHECRKTSNCN